MRVLRIKYQPFDKGYGWSIMSDFEKKFGKYAIRNLTIKLLICNIIGYILYFIPVTNQALEFISLNPGKILHGQIWRLLTWVLMPPLEHIRSNIFLILIMFYFYYSIGVTMERFWGDYKYNVYILSGFGLTIVAAFIAYAVLSLGGASSEWIDAYFVVYMNLYYILMSILLAFAATFPDNVVLFMFIIPLKMKWLGIVYGVWLVFDAVTALFAGNICKVAAIVASLLTFAIFWFSGGRLMHLRPKEVKRRNDFKRSVKITPPGITKHKCAVCGRSENDDPSLEFRFCSKCNGNYEYCQEHLFTHTHVK